MFTWARASRGSKKNLDLGKRSLRMESLEARTMLSGTPPTVIDLHAASTQWSDSFYDYLQTHGKGDHGYRIPTGSTAQTKSLPWCNIDQLAVTFSEDVNVKASNLSLTGVNAANFQVSHFFYDALGRTATWTFANPLPKNSYQLDLSGDGLRPVSDLDGNVLDGEWLNNVDAYSSGNGFAGGDFAFSFRVMPGDANQNGGVEYYDYYASAPRHGLNTTSANYNFLSDIDGSGTHEAQDSQKILAQLGSAYPSGSPLGLTNDAPTTTGGAGLSIDDPAASVAVPLFDHFQDAETPDSQLTYQIVSVSNSSLFDSTSTLGGTLTLNTAANMSGRSEIVVKATDAGGLSTFATFVVDVAYENQAPSMFFIVESVGLDTFRVFGYVSDDGPVEGLLVEFWGSFNLRASVRADGTFEFAVIVHEPDWGMEWAWVSDRQGSDSVVSEAYVGIT